MNKLQLALEVPMIIGICAVALCFMPLYLLLVALSRLRRVAVWRDWQAGRGGFYDHR